MTKRMTKVTHCLDLPEGRRTLCGRDRDRVYFRTNPDVTCKQCLRIVQKRAARLLAGASRSQAC